MKQLEILQKKIWLFALFCKLQTTSKLNKQLNILKHEARKPEPLRLQSSQNLKIDNLLRRAVEWEYTQKQPSTALVLSSRCTLKVPHGKHGLLAPFVRRFLSQQKLCFFSGTGICMVVSNVFFFCFYFETWFKKVDSHLDSLLWLGKWVIHSRDFIWASVFLSRGK